MDTNITGSTLSDCFFDSQNLIDRMNGKQYEEAFSDYKLKCEPIVRSVDEQVQLGIVQPDALATQLADKIISGWNDELAQNRKAKKFNIETRDRMFLALYLIPMLLETGVPSAMTLAEAVRDEWCRRYPKNPIAIGRYSDIAAGFRKKLFGSCFITTAVCEFDGKPDDCEELTALRRFRDEYMMSTPDGQALVRQYYDIAPRLVTAIEFCSDRQTVYNTLRDRYITPCLSMIFSGNLPACQEHYCNMVRFLQNEFCMA